MSIIMYMVLLDVVVLCSCVVCFVCCGNSEQEQLSDLALVHDSDASSLKSTSLSVLGSDDDLSFASHSVSECESAEERQSSQCDGRDVAQSELEGKAHHRDSDHLFSFDAEPSSHTASDSGSPCSSRHAGRGEETGLRNPSLHDIPSPVM